MKPVLNVKFISRSLKTELRKKHIYDPFKEAKKVGLKNFRGSALLNKVMLSFDNDQRKSSCELLGRQVYGEESRSNLITLKNKEEIMKIRMSQKFDTQMLSQNDLYKDGDYSDVFMRNKKASLDSINLHIRDSNIISREYKKSPVKIPPLKNFRGVTNIKISKRH